MEQPYIVETGCDCRLFLKQDNRDRGYILGQPRRRSYLCIQEIATIEH
jgi:hypothetical protein